MGFARRAEKRDMNTQLREVLMMQRGAGARFMPNSYVFPGGVVDARHDAAFPRERTNFSDACAQPLRVDGFADDFALRVAAVRELFEEAGLLMTANENCRELAIRSAADDSALEEWRVKVYKDPKLFSHLFVGSTKMDVSSLIPWSNWLTPVKSVPTPRYDTVFFVVTIKTSPNSTHCINEMAEAIWTEPSRIIERSVGQGVVSLPPPQYYELLRIRLAICSSAAALDKMVDPRRITPQILEADDDPTLACNLLPGDYLYKNDDDNSCEMVAPRRVSRALIMNERNAEEEVEEENARPIHRMTYRNAGEKLQYIYHELHIKHIERMAPCRCAHLFYFDARDYATFF